MHDIRITHHGSLCLVEPLTAAAWDWVAENIPEDATWWSGALVVEPRYLADVAGGVVADGLAVAA